jgi:N-acetylmuramoyl-L-alanine amidase
MLKLNKIKSMLFAVSLIAVSSTSVQAATYTVTAGDTLYSIGKVFNTNYFSIMQSNNLSTSNIYAGQKLNVPGDLYTVKSGDSLYLIAKRYSISLYSLRKANNKWDDTIYPGQRLILPGISLNNTASSGTSSSALISYTASDLDLLARLVTAEAQNQPYEAQVAVASVVVNRVRSSQFPNTISSVVYQVSNGYYQFTPVENGWINKTATETARKAAYAALHGSDPSRGALFYFDDSTKSQWLWSRPITVRIGNMVYTK